MVWKGPEHKSGTAGCWLSITDGARQHGVSTTEMRLPIHLPHLKMLDSFAAKSDLTGKGNLASR